MPTDRTLVITPHRHPFHRRRKIFINSIAIKGTKLAAPISIQSSIGNGTTLNTEETAGTVNTTT
jgi:hypothetical protein